MSDDSPLQADLQQEDYEEDRVVAELTGQKLMKISWLKARIRLSHWLTV